MNAPLVVGSALLPYVIFIFANWGVGVLLSGKGKVVHITKVVGYALYPACWLNLVGTLLSNLVTQIGNAVILLLYVYWNDYGKPIQLYEKCRNFITFSCCNVVDYVCNLTVCNTVFTVCQ